MMICLKSIASKNKVVKKILRIQAIFSKAEIIKMKIILDKKKI
jgi:hypothetical protein